MAPLAQACTTRMQVNLLIALLTIGGTSTLASAAEHRTGRCAGTGFMNVGWGGMSKDKCLERAYEVNEGPGPSGRCGHVSYSASSGPQSRGDFCQCHGSCVEPLEQPVDEQWETHVVSEPSGMHRLVIVAIVAAATLLLVGVVSVAVCCLLRRKRAAAQQQQAALAGQPPEQVIVATAVAPNSTADGSNNNGNNNEVV